MASFGAKIFLPKASEAFSTENVKYHDNISQEVGGFYRILRDFMRYQVTIMYRDSYSWVGTNKGVLDIGRHPCCRMFHRLAGRLRPHAISGRVMAVCYGVSFLLFCPRCLGRNYFLSLVCTSISSIVHSWIVHCSFDRSLMDGDSNKVSWPLWSWSCHTLPHCRTLSHCHTCTAALPYTAKRTTANCCVHCGHTTAYTATH